MILYNIGEVTDRTIHYFSLIILRGRRTTHAYPLLPLSLIRIWVHTHAYIHTRIFHHTPVFIYAPSPNYSIYSATVSFVLSSRIFASRQSRSNVLSVSLFPVAVPRPQRLAFVSRFVDSSRDLTRVRLINCAARVTRASTARANLCYNCDYRWIAR